MAGDPIKHVIMLFLENRSFDQMLGCLTAIDPAVDGINPGSPQTNHDHTGRPYSQQVTTIRQMPASPLWDPRHEVEHVKVQIEGEPAHPAAMSGFVSNFSRRYPDSTTEARQYIMDYYPLGFLPALHSLAKHFTVCDRWFSSLPGPTWPNRFFALSGTARGRVNMPGDETHSLDIPGFFEQGQETIFDRLNERGIHWKTYFHDLPQSWVMRRPRRPHNAARYFYIREFFHDALGPESQFPQFCYIEPNYMGFQQNDDHPPHDVMKGEKLIADVYNALRSNPALWANSLLVVFFDEHGGFYDHVPPPAAVPPDDAPGENGFQFNRLGVRVPALLVSPHVERRVEHTEFDHTSVLKYLIEKWALEPLGERTAQAASIGVAIRPDARRDDPLPFIEMTAEQLKPEKPEIEDEAFGLSEHHQALRRFAAYLKAKTWGDSIAAADEGLPGLYPSVVRIIEHVAFIWISIWRSLRNGLQSRRRRQKQSISQPDKIHVESSQERDDVAHFTMSRKGRALDVLAQHVRQEGVARNQAIRALASMTGRPFHEYEKDDSDQERTEARLRRRGDARPRPAGERYVDNWLAKHGYR